MKNLKKIILLGVICAFMAGVTISCEKEGAMEKAGKKVDKVVDDTKKAVEK
jgi:hypothetical protein